MSRKVALSYAYCTMRPMPVRLHCANDGAFSSSTSVAVFIALIGIDIKSSTIQVSDSNFLIG